MQIEYNLHRMWTVTHHEDNLKAYNAYFRGNLIEIDFLPLLDTFSHFDPVGESGKLPLSPTSFSQWEVATRNLVIKQHTRNNIYDQLLQ